MSSGASMSGLRPLERQARRRAALGGAGRGQLRADDDLVAFLERSGNDLGRVAVAEARADRDLGRLAVDERVDAARTAAGRAARLARDDLRVALLLVGGQDR